MFKKIFRFCSRKNYISENQQDSDFFKQQGNDQFKNGQYQQAIKSYTYAIKNSNDNKLLSICYSNRAFCHIKLESYGLALSDAQNSKKSDPTYIKAYYREGCAFYLLDRLEQAKDSFTIANKMSLGNDIDIKEKLQMVKKILKEREFKKSIEIQDTSKQQNILVQNIDNSQEHNGPIIQNDKDITSQWIISLMDYLKKQEKLQKKSLIILLKKAYEILRNEKTLIRYDYPDDIELTVCGDIHGQFYDLLNIFKINGNPSEKNPYLFNGDFVDRGSFSVEVMITLLAWKICYPQQFHLTRGNHETRNMNKLYGFEGEVLKKYDEEIFELFSEIFCSLPLVYILNSKVQVNHGGLFEQYGVILEDLEKINRFCEPPEQGLMTDLLWSDPVKEDGRHPSKRGVSIGFGPDVSKKYLKDNELELLVRSHEMKMDGYEVEADGKVITIFSAPNYCDQMGNKGAFIKFLGKDMKPKFTKFSAVSHPKIAPMAYSRGFFNLY